MLPLEFCEDLGETEKALYDELINDYSTCNLALENPVFYISKDFDVYPNYTQISSWWCLGNLHKDGIEKIISNYINNNSIAQKVRLTVPLSEMVRSCGNPLSLRLFEREDYIMYILNQYCKHRG